MTSMKIEHIVVRPDICGGKPHIAGRRITVQNIAVLSVLHHWSPEQIVSELDLTPGEVYAALSYYYDNRDEIDQSIRESDEQAEKAGTSIEQLRQRIEDKTDLSR